MRSTSSSSEPTRRRTRNGRHGHGESSGPSERPGAVATRPASVAAGALTRNTQVRDGREAERLTVPLNRLVGRSGLRTRSRTRTRTRTRSRALPVPPPIPVRIDPAASPKHDEEHPNQMDHAVVVLGCPTAPAYRSRIGVLRPAHWEPLHRRPPGFSPPRGGRRRNLSCVRERRRRREAVSRTVHRPCCVPGTARRLLGAPVVPRRQYYRQVPDPT